MKSFFFGVGFCLFSLSLVGTLRGQSDTTRQKSAMLSFGIGGSFDFKASRDELGSPLVYSGSGTPLTLHAALSIGNDLHRGDARGELSPMLSSPLTVSSHDQGFNKQTDYGLFELSYCFLHTISGSTTSKVSYKYGFALRDIFFFRTYHYLGVANQGDEVGSSSLENNGTLEIAGGIAYAFAPTFEFHAQASLPVLALVTRQDPYLYSNTFILHLATLNAFYGINASAALRYELSAAFALVAEYDFRFYRSNVDGITDAAYWNSLGLSLFWGFAL